ncbi:MAG: hypothetical protein HYW65_00590 [Candidatus Liptonbacteria bacterium]|nr:hypothetical protein [Candidatus Liptonbacteria bacterium]
MNVEITPEGNIIQSWPGGFKSVAGAKKKMPEAGKFNRRWQPALDIHNASTCRFAKLPDEEILRRFNVEETGYQSWRLAKSLFAPEPYHKLILTDQCWDEEQTRSMGGREGIDAAVHIVRKTIIEDKEPDVQISTQRGDLAAGNIRHDHLHIYRKRTMRNSDELRGWRAGIQEVAGPSSPSPSVVWDEELITVAGGVRTGQVFIFPRANSVVSLGNPYFPAYLHRLIQTFATAFRSTQGMAPDYMLEFYIRHHAVMFGMLIPILNNLGTLEWTSIYDGNPEGREWNILWSHQATAERLRETVI